MITQTLQLNLVPKGVWPRLYVSQYDAGSRTLTFEIYNGDQRFTLTSGTTAKIQGTKPDRHGFSYDADVDTSNNVITADITQQMTAAHGEAYCELVLFKSGQRIGTLNFVMMIQQAGLNDETDTSDSDLPDIIAEATEQMLTAEAYAKGTRNGTAVTSGQTGYHDNSKYYKEQAATQASNASTSATSANTNALKAEGYAVGKQNGTTQTSGTYYHNNAQYYKEQAASSATTASTKAGEASTSANTASQKASAASTSAQTASDKALVAEGYAKGTQNGTPVDSTSPYYHNNAEYFKNLANPTVAANVSFNNSGTDMSSTNVQDGIVENRTSIQNLSNYCANNGVKNVLDINIEALQSISDNLYSAATFTLNSFIAFGITWTINPDGSVKMSGTNNSSNARNLNIWKQNGASTLKKGQYIMSVRGVDSNAYVVFGGSSGTSTQTIKTDTDITIDVPSDYASFKYLLIQVAGNASPTNTIKIMIRDASISDGTMQGNSHTNEVLTQKADGITNNNATINIAPNTATLGAQENRGVTYTVYPNGTVNVNGTASENWSSLKVFENLKLKAGTYVLSGIPVGNTDSGKLRFDTSGTGIEAHSYTYGSHLITVTSDNSAINVQITVRTSGVTISNQLVKPMITTLEDYGSYDRYVPYNGKTNKELTEDVETLKSGQLNGSVKVFGQVDMNVYCTSDAIPSDFNNLTTQQATDFAQAMYDLLKKLGSGTFFMGILTVKYLKKSDGTSLGSGKGFGTIYTNVTYNNMLSNNSNARMSINVQSYGNSIFTQYGLWGSTLTYCETGVSAINLNVNDRWKGSYNTISTYKG